MIAIRALLPAAAIVCGLLTTAVFAHEGHDDAANPASVLPGADVPRAEAQSDLFEIVGVVRDGVMTIFLDRYATNDPVTDAKIDVDAGPAKGAATASPDGTYTFRHAGLSRPGQFPVTFVIAAGSDSDLMAGDLVIADPAATRAKAGDDAAPARWWWVGGVLALLAGIAGAWWSRRRRTGGIAS